MSSKRSMFATSLACCSKKLEQQIIKEAIKQIPAKGINSSSYGCLFELPVETISEKQGFGTYITFYDERITVEPPNTCGKFTHVLNDTYIKY